MHNDLPMTKEYFSRRLAELCLKSGLAGFPRDETDRHILLKIVVLVIGQTGTMTESEVNEKLGLWVLRVGQMIGLDRVTVRRTLVDPGYLIRDKSGSSYQVASPGPRPDLFAPEIDQLDVIVMGRVDLTGSMGLKRDDINAPQVFDITKNLFTKAKAKRKTFECAAGGRQPDHHL